jgi:hypothetical protein
LKEQEIEGELLDAITTVLPEGLEAASRLRAIPTGRNDLKSYLCYIKSKDRRLNSLAAEFLFEKHFTQGYMPSSYRLASWTNRLIPSTILVTVYPRGGLMAKLVSQEGIRKKTIFVPAWKDKWRDFDSDKIFKEKAGWYGLIENLNNDKELASWFHEMPINTFAGNWKLELKYGSPRDPAGCFGQFVPIEAKGLTSIGFRCIPRWKSGLFLHRVNSLDLSYLGLLTRIIQQVIYYIGNSRVEPLADKGGPVPDTRLLGLTGEALSLSPISYLGEESKVAN